jgi:hypothetical protein
LLNFQEAIPQIGGKIACARLQVAKRWSRATTAKTSAGSEVPATIDQILDQIDAMLRAKKDLLPEGIDWQKRRLRRSCTSTDLRSGYQRGC